MNTIIKHSLFLSALMLLAACGDDKKSVAEVEMSEDNAFKGQVDSLKKAEGVEKVLHDDFNRERAVIDQQ